MGANAIRHEAEPHQVGVAERGDAHGVDQVALAQARGRLLAPIGIDRDPPLEQHSARRLGRDVRHEDARARVLFVPRRAVELDLLHRDALPSAPRVLVAWMERFADRLPMPAAYFDLVLRRFGTTQFLRDALRSTPPPTGPSASPG